MKPGKTFLYFAYGSNCHVGQMAGRCPAAWPLGPATLDNWALVFRHYADIRACPGSTTHGSLWRVTPKCLRALDRYEGVHRGLYKRIRVTVIFDGRPTPAYVYVMCGDQPRARPAAAYLNVLAQGFGYFGLPLGALKSALTEAP